ncbi:MAG: DUF1761 domain-containing protein [bacterium]|nr:DUF1761 domain-containing protein [bacterium]
MQILLHSLVAALVALAVGFIYYNPKVLGNAWMKSIGKTEEELKGANMALTMGLSFVFSFMLAFFLHPVTIHQFGLNSLLMGLEGSEGGKVELMLNGSAVDYAHSFRTFKHGALHGTIAGIFFALPIIGISGLFDRRSGKYILISAGYWIITLALMGGIVCGWE